MVMPVWVSCKNNPIAEKLVYALLDTQSDTTFIDQEVSDSLNADDHEWNEHGSLKSECFWPLCKGIQLPTQRTAYL